MNQREIIKLLHTWITADGINTYLTSKTSVLDLLGTVKQLSKLPKRKIPKHGYRTFQIDDVSTIKTWSGFANRLNKKYPESYSASKEGAKFFADKIIRTGSRTIVLKVNLLPQDILFYVNDILRTHIKPDTLSDMDGTRIHYNDITNYFSDENEVVCVPGLLKSRLLSNDAYLAAYQSPNNLNDYYEEELEWLPKPMKIDITAKLPWEIK